MERCKKVGFQLFQGYYFARPEIVSGRRLSPSQASLIQLINLAGRDSDTTRIEEAFKHEPALAVNLLRIVNSVGYGLTRRIGSLRHAITLLGRRQLQRWLQLLLMTPPGKTPDVSRSPLLQVAVLRGRMMEILIEYSCPRDHTRADQAFITGIMSMMPAALGLPMNEIFEQISLEPEVMEALSSHAGDLGQTFALLECFDADDIQGCDLLLAKLRSTGLDRGKTQHLSDRVFTLGQRWQRIAVGRVSVVAVVDVARVSGATPRRISSRHNPTQRPISLQIGSAHRPASKHITES